MRVFKEVVCQWPSFNLVLIFQKETAFYPIRSVYLVLTAAIATD